MIADTYTKLTVSIFGHKLKLFWLCLFETQVRGQTHYKIMKMLMLGIKKTLMATKHDGNLRMEMKSDQRGGLAEVWLAWGGLGRDGLQQVEEFSLLL